MPFGGGSTPKAQTVTTSSNSAPWGPTQPGLQQGISDLGNIYKGGGFNIPYYPGQTVAGVAPEQAQSWKSVASLAGNPASSSVQSATDWNNKILSGDFSGIQPLMNAAQDAANSNYEAAGRYGSGYHDKAVATGVGQVAASAAATAAGQAPGLQAAQYQPAQALDLVGQERQAQGQNEINSAIQKFNYQQSQPINAIQNYIQSLSGNWGGTSTGTQTQPVYMPSPFSQGVGAASALGGLGLSAYGMGLFK